MSTTEQPAKPHRGRARGHRAARRPSAIEAGPRPRPRPDGRRHGRPEGDRPSARPPSGCWPGWRPTAVKAIAVVALAVVSVVADVGRPADPRPRHRPDLRRPDRRQTARPASPRSRPSRRCAPQGDGQARRHGLAAWTSCPARASTSTPSAQVLLLVLGVYVAASLLALARRATSSTTSCRAPCAGCATTSRTRSTAAAELLRPPAARRAAQPGHQRHRQRQPDPAADDEPAAHLAADRRRACSSMMFWISPLLALVALVSVPISMLVTGAVMKRSQGMFVAQWRRTGRLNAHIEETFSGHALVKVFGRQARGRASLRRGERRAVQGVVRRAVRQRADHAGR